MTIRRGYVGSGLTQKPTVSFDDERDREDPEIKAGLERQTWDGLIPSLERECFAIMAEASLPTEFGGFEVSHNGRRTFTNSLWTVAEAEGHAVDSRVGFAARMLDDIFWLREAEKRGDHDHAKKWAYFLGVKIGESSIKAMHGEKSRPADPARKRERDVQLAREFQRHSPGSGLSASALKAEIGRKAVRPLRRSAAIDAINRGLKILSG